MKSSTDLHAASWESPRRDSRERWAARLLWLVDGSLGAIIGVAPLVFGGRHDLGRLVFVTLVAVAAAAWFGRRALTGRTARNWSWAHAILLFAIALVGLQLVPLKPEWVLTLAPRTAELLPLWMPPETGDAAHSTFGAWRTISLTPHETTKALAMLLAYALLFIVVAERIETVFDIRRLLRCVALSGVFMAAFGIVQYFTSDGRFFWFFDHPFRSTKEYLTGSFINRNHFAGFLVLAVAPLFAWWIESLAGRGRVTGRRPSPLSAREFLLPVALASALVLVTLAILGSLSRGGAAALVVSAVVVTSIYWQRRVLDTRYAYGLVALSVTILGALSLYGYDKVAHRLDDFADGSVDTLDAGEARRKIWSANVAAFQAGWLTGTGAGSHRDINPAYLNEPHANEYTHAESGYLQIATENGIAGILLLMGGLFLVATWVYRCQRKLGGTDAILLYGACAGGLAASAFHSIFDFIWYIPACASISIVLAASLLRLAQLAGDPEPSTARTPARIDIGRFRIPARLAAGPRWYESVACVLLAGIWLVATFLGPGVAAIHWDRYLRASAADQIHSRRLLQQFMQEDRGADLAMRRQLSASMITELRSAIAWDPNFARAHERLADRLMADFELETAGSDNVMDISQIRETVFGAQFQSGAELREWLARAFGPAARKLESALFHARRSIELAPLSGAAYLYLADLSFLEGGDRAQVRDYVAQALAVRPLDKRVLFRAGRHELFDDPLAALDHWSKCFNMPGAHQQEIAYRLIASGMPAAEFVDRFQPGWQSLREIWRQYRSHGTPDDLEVLLRYAVDDSGSAMNDVEQHGLANIWFWRATMYGDLQWDTDRLACLESSHALNPRQFHVRIALGRALVEAGRIAEAESHIRWCLARRPTDKSLALALATISKQRMARREAIAAEPVVGPNEGRRHASHVVPATYEEPVPR